MVGAPGTRGPVKPVPPNRSIERETWWPTGESPTITRRRQDLERDKLVIQAKLIEVMAAVAAADNMFHYRNIIARGLNIALAVWEGKSAQATQAVLAARVEEIEAALDGYMNWADRAGTRLKSMYDNMCNELASLDRKRADRQAEIASYQRRLRQYAHDKAGYDLHMKVMGGS